MARRLRTDREPQGLKDYRYPKQHRSRTTSKRIIDATIDLMEKKPFEEISVAEIAALAQISVGGFYRRFANKEALLHWFDEHLLEEQMEELQREFDVEKWGKAPIEEAIHHYLDTGARFLYRYKQLLSRLVIRARSESDPMLLERARRFNREAHRHFIRFLSQRRKEIRHPDPEVAVPFGLMISLCALREAILFGERKLYDLPEERWRLVAEVTRCYVRYLTCDRR